MKHDDDQVLQETLQADVERRKNNHKPHPDWRYTGLEEFVLLNGRPYQPQRLPRSYRKGAFRFCFGNAFNTAKRHGLVYIEGYALSAGMHIHAWCVEPGSELVIDRTWAEGRAYYGVAFDLGFVSRTLKSRGSYGVLDNWEEGWPLLTLPPDEWKHRG